ncbi:MAG: serine/threonine protein kinase [Frankiales bacterium]|nr:serine/threonine protein kinase [Frankiales bacterium]
MSRDFAGNHRARHRFDGMEVTGGAVRDVLGGRYRLLYRLEGETPRFTAYDSRLHRPVKVIFPGLDGDGADLLVCVDDQGAAPALTHPVLEPLLDVGLHDDGQFAYLVTSHQPTTTLAQCTPSSELGRSVLREIADLLAYLHGLGLGHSGLFPRAIRIAEQSNDDDCRVRVPFLGLYVQSKSADRAAPDDVADLAALTLEVWRPAEGPSSGDGAITRLLLDMARQPAIDRPAAVDVAHEVRELARLERRGSNSLGVQRAAPDMAARPDRKPRRRRFSAGSNPH